MTESFLNQIRQHILENIEDENFGVEELSKAMGYSRYQLYRKIKEISDKSISRFIIQVRLEKSVELLQSENRSISEIAYGVGFSSPSYFNKCFIKEYGQTPGDYKKSWEENKNKEQDFTDSNSTPSKKRKFVLLSSFFLIIIVSVVVFFTTRNGSNFNNIDNYQASIAVLPFQDLSQNKDQEYLADGITEALTSELAKMKSLRIPSRTSVMTYKNVKKLSTEIAEELNVNLILEGSVIREKDSLTIIVQLVEIKPQEEKHLWSESYESRFTNTLQVIKSISGAVAQKVGIVVSDDQEELVTYTLNPEAYNLFLKGKHLLNQKNPRAVRASIDLFEQSIAIDSAYAPVYSALSDAFVTMNKLIRDNELKLKHRENGRWAAKKAIELNPNLSSSCFSQANVLGKFDWDWEGMKEMIDRGLKIEPNNSYGHLLLSDYYVVKGEFKKALQEAIKAEQLDPVNPQPGTTVARRLFLTNDYTASIQKYQEVLDLFPYYGFAWDGIGFAHFYQGNLERAVESWQKLQFIMGNDSIAKYYTLEDYKDSFRYWMKKAKGSSPQFCSNPSVIAEAHMLMNEHEEAIEYLQIAYRYRNEDLPLMMQRADFYPLHNHPEFQLLVEKTGITLPPF